MIHQHQLKNNGFAISPDEMLPTMYDLPSENPEEPGVPDQFHTWQSELLTQTFVPPDYDPNCIMIASDLNLYYDVNHFRNYKRPDWYAALGVSKLYGDDLVPRMSYVIWQEKVVPFVVVELLSPGTEDEDLGRTQRKSKKLPTKWEVYEQILGIPYYAVFSRRTDKLRAFKHDGGMYHEIVLPDRRLWIPELKIGLGVWKGKYQGERDWLRWYDAQKNWIPTPVEQEKQRAEHEKQRAEYEKQRAEHEKQRAEQEKQRAEHEKQQKYLFKQQLENEREQTKRLLELLKESGIDRPDLFRTFSDP
ncbi:MAG: Uma2 family endonuclease [Desulfobacterales bacterium]|nr:Uma2 family endonuclease [Desulfobacterales bacterium]